MRGFSSNWHDVRGFIIGITKEIWDCRKIGSLHKRYTDGLIVLSPASALVGYSYVIATTMATLAEFLDCEHTLIDETAIWKQISPLTGQHE
jgi:hypothetical protein